MAQDDSLKKELWLSVKQDLENAIERHNNVLAWLNKVGDYNNGMIVHKAMTYQWQALANLKIVYGIEEGEIDGTATKH